MRIADGSSVSRNGWRVDQPLYVAVDGGPEQAPVAVRFRDRLIVAMGDSYISGEGNPDVPSVIADELNKRRRKLFSRPSWVNKLNERKGDYQRAQWWDERCHRSLLSWPVLASLAYAARKPDEAVTLVHLGCSAATVGDILDRGQVDLPGGGNEPYGEPQLTQLQDLLSAAPPGWERRKPDRLLLSVGGNDIGFGGVIATITLPPNGYTLGPLAARVVGKKGKAVCPYDKSGLPLSRLCRSELSAETRFKALPGRYEALARALLPLVDGRIYQFTYPNPLLGEGRRPCHSAYPQGKRLSDTGFNSLMGVVAPIARGFRFRSWNFEINYRAEKDFNGKYLIPGSQVECDTDPDQLDSEVCQALWVHSELNHAVRENGENKRWTVVESHTRAIDGHGICLADGEFRLRLPLVSEDGTWEEGWTPRSFRPYHEKLPRWFRVTNDSAVTQYGGPDHFYHGTIHPTYRAHLAYAQAALDEALLVAEPSP